MTLAEPAWEHNTITFIVITVFIAIWGPAESRR